MRADSAACTEQHYCSNIATTCGEQKKSLERGQGFPVMLAKPNEGRIGGNTISSDGNKEWRKAKMNP